MKYIVRESVGNHEKIIGEFDNMDSASEFVMDRALDDARDTFPDGTHLEDIPEEFEDVLQLALSYYDVMAEA